MRWSCSKLTRFIVSRRHLSAAVLTAPVYPRGQLILHSASKPQDWPARIADPVYTGICALNLEGIGIAYAYDERASTDGQGLEAILFTPTAYRVPFAITTSNLTELQRWLEQPAKEALSQRRIYVCIHGSRDCRCGEVGGLLFERLCLETRRRALEDIAILPISHIGGHRWAANAIIYPQGDWLGLLAPCDAPRLIEYIMNPSATPWWSRWRGRTGLLEQARNDLFATESTISMQSEAMPTELGEQIKVCFETHDGTLLEVMGFEGESLMQVCKRHELVEATCEGQCECATCAVDFSNSPALPKTVSPPTEEELDQLEFALFRTPTTRLACQVPLATLTEWLRKGGRIKLPRY